SGPTPFDAPPAVGEAAPDADFPPAAPVGPPPVVGAKPSAGPAWPGSDADEAPPADAGRAASGPPPVGPPPPVGAPPAAPPPFGATPAGTGRQAGPAPDADFPPATPVGPPPAWSDVDTSGSRPSLWDGTDTSSIAEAEDVSVAPPATVFAPPLVADAGESSGPASEARTAILPRGSALPPTAVQQAPPPARAPGPSPSPAPDSGRGDVSSADTAKAARPGGAPPPVPPPPPAPGPRPAPAPAAGGGVNYVPTQAVSPEMIDSLRRTVNKPGGAPGPVPPPPPPPAPKGGAAGPPSPPPPPPPPGPGPAQASPPPVSGAGRPAGYGYPPPPAGQPTVGSGYMAVLRYRAADGSEQQLIRRSAPGMPHPEWQILHELHAMGVPPQQVIELHTELQSCELPGGYCARMIRETWPQVRITHTAAYGQDFASRQAGVRHLVEHQDELQQFADGPPRSQPVRAALPQQQPAPAVGLDVIGQELTQAYGPQGVFRYQPQLVSRQGVPEIVTQSLVWSGLPVEIRPIFWAQAQPGRPIPTLAELAAERGVRPAMDAGSYLVLGSDFGQQLCVQYGTAHVVAVPLEGSPDGQPSPARFVNTSLPQFARCMALLGRMWRLRYGLDPEQAGRWTTDFQAELASLDPQAVLDPENWWSVLLEQMWDGLL
ncbi:SUKH-4 family immunity protein, partial [Streptomyces sp. NPDC127098]|uniref:SUKH-4 family immunity protein n=1 Tax=Streptomyces sp. NPDC127098 TaxID=3347137 RepID=UPI003659D959